MRSSSSAALACGSSPTRSAASSGSMASSTSAARAVLRAEMRETASSSDSSSTASARRASSSSAATSTCRASGRSDSTSARSAGLRSSMVASSAVAPCRSAPVARPETSSGRTMSVSPRRRPRGPEEARWTNRRVTFQSLLRSGSMATSRMVTRPEPSRRVTTRSSSSPTTRVSALRCSKRRILTRPVVMTWPGLMAVTRDRGRKTRRRPETSMTKPTARGSPRMRMRTMTSWTLPTGSPIGSKTVVSTRRATKTLDDAGRAPARVTLFSTGTAYAP